MKTVQFPGNHEIGDRLAITNGSFLRHAIQQADRVTLSELGRLFLSIWI
ncbi:hypothetical protein RMSM_03412 [Rhodopirellula maiorica SM1]|uniref:Uncharacterized protein n=1 Tax=Rhodopirellula maiorica SM1 TaxID=1265738 RepID=M5RK22_9BACT|nr:hypothetical protein RMSM_03412 [Rhodopirellula maiorica SM1]